MADGADAAAEQVAQLAVDGDKAAPKGKARASRDEPPATDSCTLDTSSRTAAALALAGRQLSGCRGCCTTAACLRRHARAASGSRTPHAALARARAQP